MFVAFKRFLKSRISTKRRLSKRFMQRALIECKSWSNDKLAQHSNELANQLFAFRPSSNRKLSTLDLHFTLIHSQIQPQIHFTH